MKILIIFMLVGLMALVAAACGTSGTNNSNAANNSATSAPANANIGANNGGHESMPMSDANHQRMGDDHGRQTANREMRNGRPMR